MTASDASSPVAVVTAGARGIGLAIARWFLSAGRRVAVWDIDAETLGRAAAELNDPARVLALHCGVSQPEQVLAVDGGFDVARVGLPTPRRNVAAG